MFHKNSSILLLSVLLFLTLFSSISLAKHKAESPAIPEKNGIYNDPDHPGIKVRVFVHHEKPQVTPSNTLSCDLVDADSTAKVDKTGWMIPSGNWSYSLNVSSVPVSVGGANLAKIVANGFDAWEAAAANKITFVKAIDTTETRSKYDGKNVIAWGRTSGNTLGVTYTRYNTSSGLVVDVDTIMNQRMPWGWSESSTTCAIQNVYDAENILTHELGHWLGLDDEYDQTSHKDATMYGYGAKGEVKKNTLTTGDISGATAIYNP